MRRRQTLLIVMQLLEILIQEPRGPTRLAQAANLNYERLQGYMQTLFSNGLAATESRDGHDTYSATPKGKELYFRWAKIFEEVKLP